MNIPERDGDGYLANRDTWTPEIGRAFYLDGRDRRSRHDGKMSGGGWRA